MERPQVLIDGLVFENTGQIGIYRIFYEVMKRTSSEVDYTVLLGSTAQHPIPGGVNVEYSYHRHTPRRRQFDVRHRKQRSRQYLKSRYPDAIWHSTFFSVDPSPSRRCVVSMYDMIAERYFWMSPLLAQQRCDKEQALAQADSVLAISQTTAEDLLRFRPEFCDKVHVMPLGTEHLDAEEKSGSANVAPRNDVLFLGGRAAYKNFFAVVEAMKDEAWPRDQMLIVAGVPFSSAETELIRYYGVSDRVRHAGFVSDDELQRLYRRALCLVFPSLLEGFGIPIVESQANGCVPLLSDTPVFREVAREAAIYFDPFQPRSIARALSQATRPETRNDLVLLGQENFTRFKWDCAAAATLQCYRSLL